MKIRKLLTLFALGAMVALTGQTSFAQTAKPSWGKTFMKEDGSPRTMTVLLYDGMTALDFIGFYTVFNAMSGPDLKIKFVAKKKGLVHDERNRLKLTADYSIDEVSKTDILVIPGGNHLGVVKDKKTLAWVKKMYDSSEYTVSVCTGGIILGAAGATTGMKAGVAWGARGFLAPLNVTYVPTPPPSIDGKYYSAAGAAAGMEISLMLLEKITGSKHLSEVAEFAAEWNPKMLYGSGDPQKAPPRVIQNFMDWAKTDPLFQEMTR